MGAATRAHSKVRRRLTKQIVFPKNKSPCENHPPVREAKTERYIVPVSCHARSYSAYQSCWYSERYAALFRFISSRMMRLRVSSHFGFFPSTYSRSAELINVW